MQLRVWFAEPASEPWLEMFDPRLPAIEQPHRVSGRSRTAERSG
eukprot:COSAG06_NODE_941_length_11384_cov_4.377492_12_plen_44_part_00